MFLNGKNVEKYFSTQIMVLKKSDDDQDLYVEIGEFTYPFKFDLPNNLPTSFEHVNGTSCISTRYTVNGTLDIPW